MISPFCRHLQYLEPVDTYSIFTVIHYYAQATKAWDRVAPDGPLPWPLPGPPRGGRGFGSGG
jgi:hypothetical protein